MKKGLPIYLIYTYKKEQSQYNDVYTDDATYHALKVFNDDTVLTKKESSPIYEELFKRDVETEWQCGPFYNLNDLNRFSLALTEELEAPYITVLSVQDYNAAIEAIQDLDSFKQMFENTGLKLESPYAQNRKSTFFSRIFRES